MRYQIALAGFIIMIAEVAIVGLIWRRYRASTWEEFLSRCTIEEAFRCQRHSINGFLGFCLATIARLFP